MVLYYNTIETAIVTQWYYNIIAIVNTMILYYNAIETAIVTQWYYNIIAIVTQ